MSNISLTVRPAMPTADLESQNPLIYQFEMLSENDGLKRAKINFGSSPRGWNDLDYWNPSGETGGGSGGVQIATTTVQTNVGTKQALLAAVPTGKVRIVTMVVARKATAFLGDLTLSVILGFDAGVANVVALLPETLPSGATATTPVIIATLAGSNAGVVGVAGDILGVIFQDTDVEGELTFDVHYYDVDA